MKQKGFTLIELLTVISIISLLANSAFAALYSARINARDAERFAELDQFRKGLEFYYDTYGVYPCGDFDVFGTHTADTSLSCPVTSYTDEPGFLNGGTSLLCDTTLGPSNGLFSEDLLSTNCPKDPLNAEINLIKYTYVYAVSIDRQTYTLGAYLEDNDSAMLQDGGLCSDAYEIGSGVGTLTLNYAPNSIGIPGVGC